MARQDNPNAGNIIEELRAKAAKLPAEPGVYLMKDKAGGIIYVGKAKRLKNRVTSYFTGLDSHTPKTAKLVSQIRSFDTIVTSKELDALVLECSLIKLHRPKYNILLKDAKGFSYIKISSGDYPRITNVFRNDDKTAKYIGPYASGFTVRQAVDNANRIFALPSCNKKFPEEFNKSRPCLNYQIKRCMGVCLGKISKEEYADIVKAAVNYIKSGGKESVRALTAEMEAAAETLDFEKAARLRDRIRAIKRAEEIQSVQPSGQGNYDIAALAENTGIVAAAVVKYRNGVLSDKECFYLGGESVNGQTRREFLLEYYSERRDNPQKILELHLDGECEDKELLEEYLNVKITVPKRGEGLVGVTLAKSNALEFLSQRVDRTAKELDALEELAKILGLNKTPEYIECYDISNIGENVKIGGMVVYLNGRPLKSGYRKFTIKSVDGIDDYACMREVLSRRLARYFDNDKAFSRLPDLILLDGGSGHVSAVRETLNESGLDLPLFGLVKDSKHKTRAIAADNGEIEISSKKSAFTLLSRIQEEVHRFSVSFARDRHSRQSGLK